VYQDIDPYTRMKTAYYFLSPAGQDYFRDIPQGQRGGGDKHNIIISEWVRNYRANGWYCFVDTGDEVGKKRPDILVYPNRIVDTEKGKIMDVEHWDYKNRFAVEVEIDAVKHVSPDPEKDRIYQNLVKNKLRGVKVEFVVWSEEDRDAVVNSLREKLGREYGDWVKGVTVYRPTIVPVKLQAGDGVQGQIQEDIKPSNVKVEDSVPVQLTESPKVQEKTLEPDTVTSSSPTQLQFSTEKEEPRGEAAGKVSEKVKLVKNLLEKGYSVNVYVHGKRKNLYMVPPGVSRQNLGDQVFIGELTYELVKFLGLNEVPSGAVDKLRFYLDRGYVLKCRSSGALSVYPPGASVNEEYIGNVVDGGKLRLDIVEALKDYGIEVYFEGSSAKIRRYADAKGG
ncbi:MAG: hypothetical protein ACPL07_03125, partial [Candidatus Bathyarchaeia archaeon]